MQEESAQNLPPHLFQQAVKALPSAAMVNQSAGAMVQSWATEKPASLELAPKEKGSPMCSIVQKA